MGNVLVCDDERSICQVLEVALRRDGHRVETVNTCEAAKNKINTAVFDVIVTDIRMPTREEGLDVLRHARRVSPESAVVLMTAVGELESAIEAVREGAFRYILKEPGRDIHNIKQAVSDAMQNAELRRENFALKRDAAQRNSLNNIIGNSGPIVKLKQTIETVASTSTTILIRGESGTGKELVARAVHSCSPRADKPFVCVNCGAFPETLLESELFGYVKGAFTGANQNKRGLFEVASDGTIFLDEISEMSLAMQVKLLRVLQERTIRPVGGTTEAAVDVRVIAATNKDLEQMVAEGTFREDLYYRISVIPINVPPLRERGDDIELLANHFLKKFAASMGKAIHCIAPESIKLLKGYDWPGNVRVLENTIERSVAMESSDELHVQLPAEIAKTRAAAAAPGGPPGISIPSGGIDFERHVADVERSLIQSALRQANGVQTRAAEVLNLSYRSFRHLLKKYDL
ncbi:MAG: sigma-54-dependent transcriptional regulator [Terriglobales bacterium]